MKNKMTEDEIEGIIVGIIIIAIIIFAIFWGRSCINAIIYSSKTVYTTTIYYESLTSTEDGNTRGVSENEIDRLGTYLNLWESQHNDRFWKSVRWENVEWKTMEGTRSRETRRIKMIVNEDISEAQYRDYFERLRAMEEDLSKIFGKPVEIHLCNEKFKTLFIVPSLKQ